MRIYAFILLFCFYSVECRKAIVPINKNANIDFINMEAGGVRPPNNIRPGTAQAPAQAPVPTTVKPAAPAPAPAPQPKNPTPTTVAPVASPKQLPTQAPTLITPKPVNPTPAAKPITTPGPGSVKQLITFYDSQGKASPIRPYTYSQAVKQG
ncbi:translation initiation factor IF-2-like [Nymphalis io]|uniref:translation initiation factor IF-2-like n=1 Tax=Inachis io TaxID=171585 RepID=UPI0021671DC0|nr:translation initiation factor IF-2-like [Nymphalis io]